MSQERVKKTFKDLHRYLFLFYLIQGDFGGPLICGKKKNRVVFGIMSWEIGCQNKNAPGEIFARVAHYRHWIDKFIKGVKVRYIFEISFNLWKT